MQRNFFLLALICILSFYSTNSQDYFAGLSIDPILLQHTNQALLDLKSSLYSNFDCNFPVAGFAQNMNGNSNRNLQIQQASSLNEPVTPFKDVQGLPGYRGSQPQFRGQNPNNRADLLLSISQKVELVKFYLGEIRKILYQYNNIVIGSANSVHGYNNMVIGSQNSLVGDNSWVFASDFTSSELSSGVLIIEIYLIQLSDIMEILSNPQRAIHCVDQEESNRSFKALWN